MPTSLLDLTKSQFDANTSQGPETLRQSPSLITLPTLPVIAGYEVIAEIGRGGMGVVYRARDPELKRHVAIKMLLDPEFASPEQRMRFKVEAEAVAQLRHPNIVQVHELGEMVSGNGSIAHPYMVLEYIEGPTLFRYLRQHPLSERESAALMITLAHAIQHAHDHGLIHRDLKPANILLQTDTPSDSGTREYNRLLDFMPKITDFGLVKALVFEGEARRDLTRPELMVGTPQYMAPEQANPASHSVSCSVDIYSLGVILYELLTGQLPYDDKDILKMLMEVQTQEPVSPRKLQPRLSMDLETICLKCLQKKPQDRYHSAAALADDLARFLHHEPIQARPLSEWQRIAKWVRRYPLVASLAAGLFSVISIALIVIGFLWRQADADRLQAIEHSRDAESARDVARFAEQGARQAEQSAKVSERSSWRSLYFSRIAQADLMLRQGLINRPFGLLDTIKSRKDMEDPRSWEWYHLRQLCNPMESLIDSPQDYVRQVAIHPAQNLIYCIEGPEYFENKKPEDFVSRLIQFKQDPESKAWLTQMIYQSPMPLREVHLVLGGSKAVLADMDHDLVVVDLKQPERLQHISDVIRIPRHSSWKVAEQAGLVLLWQQDATELELYDVREERVSKKLPLPSAVQAACISSDGQRIAYVLRNAKVAVFDLKKNQHLWEEPLPPGNWKLVMDAGGKMLALLNNKDGDWRWLNAQSGQHLLARKRPGYEEMVFSQDGTRLAVQASGYSGGEIQIWRMERDGNIEQLPLILRGHQGRINGFSFHPDGMKLLSYGADGTLRLWDTSYHPVQAGSELHFYRGHTGNVLSALFNPHNDQIVSGGLDANVMIWDSQKSVDRDQVAPSLGCGGEWLSAYRFITGTRLIAIFEQKNTTISHFDLDTRRVVKSIKVEGANNVFAAPRYDAIFSPDGKTLAVCNLKRDLVLLFDSLTGELLWKTSPSDMRVLQIHFSGNGKRLLFAGHFPDPTVSAPRAIPYQCGYQVWDLASRKLVLESRLPAYFSGFAINQDGSRVAASLRHPAQGSPKEVFAVHILLVNEQGREALRIPSTLRRSLSLAFSPDDKWIACSNFDPEKNHIVLWNAETGKLGWRQFSLFESTHIAFTKDSKRLLNTGYNSDVTMFDTISGSEVLSLKSHGNPRVGDYALSPKIVFNEDETLLTVHSWDAGFSLWHAFPAAEYNRNPSKFEKVKVENASIDLNAVTPHTP